MSTLVSIFYCCVCALCVLLAGPSVAQLVVLFVRLFLLIIYGGGGHRTRLIDLIVSLLRYIVQVKKPPCELNKFSFMTTAESRV